MWSLPLPMHALTACSRNTEFASCHTRLQEQAEQKAHISVLRDLYEDLQLLKVSALVDGNPCNIIAVDKTETQSYPTLEARNP